MDVLKLSAFSLGETGGNPAGVVIADELPLEQVMQQVAADVGYSETVFASPLQDGWRVRYFSPETEVPFCGHATIALGAALANRFGNRRFRLTLNHTDISVEGIAGDGTMSAALFSPPTKSHPASQDELLAVLALFGYGPEDIDDRIPPAVIHGGSDHFALTLKSRDRLAQMTYDLEAGRRLMTERSWITIMLAVRESDALYHSRNAFAIGGVYEDPATGSATAAYSGYLRDLGQDTRRGWEFRQGEDMGMPSIIRAAPVVDSSSIRVEGAVRTMA